MQELDLKFMKMAIAEAALSAKEGEPPIGAVLTCGEAVLACAHNHRERDYDVTSHAEIEVLRAAGKQKGDWRMSDCTLYVTLEPCPMCAGTVVNARMGRVVYGAKDAKAGAMGSVLSVNAYPLNHKAQVTAGVLEQECAGLLREFFESKRKK